MGRIMRRIVVDCPTLLSNGRNIKARRVETILQAKGYWW